MHLNKNGSGLLKWTGALLALVMVLGGIRLVAISFALNQVIPGWTEALQLMKEGAKWELFIPPDLAYGPMGSPPVIAPNMALVFEIELIDIK